MVGQVRGFTVVFQSTLPLRGATGLRRAVRQACRNFNPHSPCGERRRHGSADGRRLAISIHTPLAGSDGLANGIVDNNFIFQSTLPLRGATRTMALPRCTPVFQSTLPLRGATPDSCANAGSNAAYFNPHSPCGERPRQVDHATVTHDISIHTPLAGSDDGQRLEHDRSDQFQSTLPLRGATHHQNASVERISISIHTPLAGSDLTRSSHRTFDRFQSTLPLRGATAEMRHF